MRSEAQPVVTGSTPSMKAGLRSARTSGRVVGALFLLAFVAYGTGSALVVSGSGSPAVLADVAANQVQISAGALLMLINSAVVAGIGVLVFPVLRTRHEIFAHAYLIARIFEAVMLAVGTLFLLLLIPLAREYVDAGAAEDSVLPSLARVAQEGSQYAYLVAMIGLGLGSLPFCGVLLRAKLVPGFIAVWGLAGYALMTTGMTLDVLGHDVGLVLSIPGGLFEVALGALLVVKGFRASEH